MGNSSGPIEDVIPLAYCIYTMENKTAAAKPCVRAAVRTKHVTKRVYFKNKMLVLQTHPMKVFLISLFVLSSVRCCCRSVAVKCCAKLRKTLLDHTH